MSRESFGDFQNRLKQIEEELASEQDRCKTVLEGAQFLIGVAGAEKRKIAQANTYQVKKLSGLLADGGFGRNFSMLASKMIRASDAKHIQPTGDVDWDSLAIWDETEDHVKSKEVLQKVKKF